MKLLASHLYNGHRYELLNRTTLEPCTIDPSIFPSVRLFHQCTASVLHFDTNCRRLCYRYPPLPRVLLVNLPMSHQKTDNISRHLVYILQAFKQGGISARVIGCSPNMNGSSNFRLIVHLSIEADRLQLSDILRSRRQGNHNWSAASPALPYGVQTDI